MARRSFALAFTSYIHRERVHATGRPPHAPASARPRCRHARAAARRPRRAHPRSLHGWTRPHACRRKLAGLIAYIPLPVVAGYLGYVGYFCLAAGAAQSSGQPISSLPSWLLLLSEDAWLPSLAGFGSFIFIYVTLRNWRHPLCMPTVLCLVRPPPPVHNSHPPSCAAHSTRAPTLCSRLPDWISVWHAHHPCHARHAHLTRVKDMS